MLRGCATKLHLDQGYAKRDVMGRDAILSFRMVRARVWGGECMVDECKT